MRCQKCGKLVKEDTEGNPRYCQGHGWMENQVKEEDEARYHGKRSFHEMEEEHRGKKIQKITRGVL